MEDTLKKLSYGLYILTARKKGRDNGCVINSVLQVTQDPTQVAVCVNKQNLTRDMILETGKFNLSVLNVNSKFSQYRHWGMQSGHETDKMEDILYERSKNGLIYITEDTNSFLSADVVDNIDLGTHTLFIGKVTENKVLNDYDSVTYEYYHRKIKPQFHSQLKKAFICTVCGYIYEGDALPPGFICPVCKHGSIDFVETAV